MAGISALPNDPRTMCYFITIAVPRPHSLRICREYSEPGITVAQTANPSALACAGQGFAPLLVTGGGCSCAWYTPPPRSGSNEEQDRRRRRYERLGWRLARIERALGDACREPTASHGLHPVIVDVLVRLSAELGVARVWIHDFRNKVEHERYEAVGLEECSDHALTVRARTLVPDVVLTVTRHDDERRPVAPRTPPDHPTRRS